MIEDQYEQVHAKKTERYFIDENRIEPSSALGRNPWLQIGSGFAPLQFNARDYEYQGRRGATGLCAYRLVSIFKILSQNEFAQTGDSLLSFVFLLNELVVSPRFLN